MSILLRIKNGELPSINYMTRRIAQLSADYAERYGVSKKAVFVDYFFNAVFRGCSGADYFLYDFYFLNRRGKNKFATDEFHRRYEKNMGL